MFAFLHLLRKQEAFKMNVDGADNPHDEMWRHFYRTLVVSARASRNLLDFAKDFYDNQNFRLAHADEILRKGLLVRGFIRRTGPADAPLHTLDLWDAEEHPRLGDRFTTIGDLQLPLHWAIRLTVDLPAVSPFACTSISSFSLTHFHLCLICRMSS